MRVYFFSATTSEGRMNRRLPLIVLLPFPLWLGCSDVTSIPHTQDIETQIEDEPTESDSDVVIPSGRLSVVDGMLVDESGRRVTLSGLGLGDLESLKGLGLWNETYFENARSWGAKLVRLPVNPVTFRSIPEEMLSDLDDAVRWCENSDLYLIIDFRIIGNVPEGLFLWEGTGATWQEIRDFWEAVGERFRDNPTVAFAEIYNEPASLWHMGGSWDFAD